METLTKTNKEAVRDFYEVILNQRKLDLLDDIISEDYINVQGEQGAQAFRKTVEGILAAFPDARWKVESIVAEENSVVVRHTLTGTHQNAFQNIPGTGKKFSNDGWALYELINGKIIRSQVQTDRLSFLQQISVLPEDPLIHARRSDTYVYFVDRFHVPKDAVDAFTERMNHNRAFIKSIPGFVRDEVMATKLENGDLSIMTVAVWETIEHLDNARKVVQEEYRKINFDPAEFTKRHGITMERQLYHVHN
ncbi:MAG TPA: ester cyclase [Cyclobacteriaceae bacterium]|nr:ester cyclase [Cyclobacteriaceae bacterium]